MDPRDGSWIVSYHDERGLAALYRLDHVGNATAFLAEAEADLRLPTFSRDGRWFSFIETRHYANGAFSHRLVKLDLVAGTREAWGETFLWVQRTALAPDGRHIGFVQSPETGQTAPWVSASNEADVWLADGDQFRRLSDWQANFITGLVFLDNETMLANPYNIPSRRPPNLDSVYRVTLSGQTSRHAADNPPDDVSPSALCLHPDGHTLVVDTSRLGQFDLRTGAWSTYWAPGADDSCLSLDRKYILYLDKEYYATDPRHIMRLDVETQEIVRWGPW